MLKEAEQKSEGQPDSDGGGDRLRVCLCDRGARNDIL